MAENLIQISSISQSTTNPGDNDLMVMDRKNQAGKYSTMSFNGSQLRNYIFDNSQNNNRDVAFKSVSGSINAVGTAGTVYTAKVPTAELAETDTTIAASIGWVKNYWTNEKQNVAQSISGNFTVGGDVTLSKLAGNYALVTDANKNIAESRTTSAEIGYLSGVTGAIQTQLNGKVSKTNPEFTGTITTPLSSNCVVSTNGDNQLVATSISKSTLETALAGIDYSINTKLNEKAVDSMTLHKGTADNNSSEHVYGIKIFEDKTHFTKEISSGDFLYTAKGVVGQNATQTLCIINNCGGNSAYIGLNSSITSNYSYIYFGVGLKKAEDKKEYYIRDLDVDKSDNNLATLGYVNTLSQEASSAAKRWVEGQNFLSTVEPVTSLDLKGTDSGGYINFHYNGSEDYTSRIVESTSGNIDISGNLTRDGKSSSYVSKGRDNAFIRQKTGNITKYMPVISVKTGNGSWDCGPNKDNNLCFNYVSDSTYSTDTDTPDSYYSLYSGSIPSSQNDNTIATTKWVKDQGYTTTASQAAYIGEVIAFNAKLTQSTKDDSSDPEILYVAGKDCFINVTLCCQKSFRADSYFKIYVNEQTVSYLPDISIGSNSHFFAGVAVVIDSTQTETGANRYPTMSWSGMIKKGDVVAYKCKNTNIITYVLASYTVNEIRN